MRLRNVRGAREEMLVNPYVIQEPQQYKGHVAIQILATTIRSSLRLEWARDNLLHHLLHFIQK